MAKGILLTISKITTGKIETADGVRKCVTLVDGDSVRDTVARVEDDTGGTSRGVQRKYGLDGDVKGRGVESLEHDLSHLLSVDLWVEGSLGQEDGVLFGCDSKLVVEGVMPNLDATSDKQEVFVEGEQG